jgi:hypothetical protein
LPQKNVNEKEVNVAKVARKVVNVARNVGKVAKLRKDEPKIVRKKTKYQNTAEGANLVVKRVFREKIIKVMFARGM